MCDYVQQVDDDAAQQALNDAAPKGLCYADFSSAPAASHLSMWAAVFALAATVFLFHAT